MLIDAGIQIGVVGRGRIFESSMISGLWRYLKHQKAHLKNYGDFIDARKGLSAYFLFYNNVRPHQGIGSRVPVEVYSGKSCMVSVA